MGDSFWKVTAVLAIASLFYIGHGMHLHEPSTGSLLTSTAHADGIEFTQDDGSVFLTTSADGDTVFLWRLAGGNRVNFLAHARANR